jgi:Rrf2 family iron-sulfur cluster assembly transcriptional regulator
MLDLALHYDRGPVSLAEIAERQGISQSYLEQLFARLRRNGLVDGLRGPAAVTSSGAPAAPSRSPMSSMP